MDTGNLTKEIKRDKTISKAIPARPANSENEIFGSVWTELSDNIRKCAYRDLNGNHTCESYVIGPRHTYIYCLHHLCEASGCFMQKLPNHSKFCVHHSSQLVVLLKKKI